MTVLVLRLIALLTLSALCQQAISCGYSSERNYDYYYDEITKQAYFLEKFSNALVYLDKSGDAPDPLRQAAHPLKVNLQKNFKVIRADHPEFGLIFATDGEHAYYMNQLIIGAKDLTTLEPIESKTTNGTPLWLYFKDKENLYAISPSYPSLDSKEPMKLIPIGPLDTYKINQHILLYHHKAYREAQKLPFKAEDFNVQKIVDGKVLISDGQATYSYSREGFKNFEKRDLNKPTP